MSGKERKKNEKKVKDGKKRFTKLMSMMDKSRQKHDKVKMEYNRQTVVEGEAFNFMDEGVLWSYQAS